MCVCVLISLYRLERQLFLKCKENWMQSETYRWRSLMNTQCLCPGKTSPTSFCRLNLTSSGYKVWRVQSKFQQSGDVNTRPSLSTSSPRQEQRARRQTFKTPSRVPKSSTRHTQQDSTRPRCDPAAAAYSKTPPTVFNSLLYQNQSNRKSPTHLSTSWSSVSSNLGFTPLSRQQQHGGVWLWSLGLLLPVPVRGPEALHPHLDFSRPPPVWWLCSAPHVRLH